MYQLHKTDDGYILTQAQSGFITIPSQAELIELHTILGSAIEQTAPPKAISSVQARTIAEKNGHSLPTTTLVSACANRTIPSAEKVGGRWFMQKSDFLEWLDQWAKKTA